jgi:hypothetical protein
MRRRRPPKPSDTVFVCTLARPRACVAARACAQAPAGFACVVCPLCFDPHACNWLPASLDPLARLHTHAFSEGTSPPRKRRSGSAGQPPLLLCQVHARLCSTPTPRLRCRLCPARLDAQGANAALDLTSHLRHIARRQRLSLALPALAFQLRACVHVCTTTCAQAPTGFARVACPLCLDVPHPNHMQLAASAPFACTTEWGAPISAHCCLERSRQGA